MYISIRLFVLGVKGLCYSLKMLLNPLDLQTFQTYNSMYADHLIGKDL